MAERILGIKITRSRAAKVIVSVFLSAVFVLCISLGSALFVRAGAAEDNCRGINEVRGALRNIITRSQTVIASNPDYTQAEKEAGLEFYNRALKDLRFKKC